MRRVRAWVPSAVPPLAAVSSIQAAMGSSSAKLTALGLALAVAATGCGVAVSTPVPSPLASTVNEPSVNVAVRDMTLQPPHFSVPAGRPFRIAFANEDGAMAHGLVIEQGTTDLWRGAPVQGPGTAIFEVPALAEGTYTIYCEVHIGITGILDAVGSQ